MLIEMHRWFIGLKGLKKTKEKPKKKRESTMEESVVFNNQCKTEGKFQSLSAHLECRESKKIQKLPKSLGTFQEIHARNTQKHTKLSKNHIVFQIMEYCKDIRDDMLITSAEQSVF